MWQGRQTITWTTSNAGRPLAYIVKYSSDGAQTWTPMTIDLADSTFQFNTAKINGGSQVFFRVTSSNGLSTGSATAGPISIPQNPQVDVSPTSLNFGGQTTEASSTVR